MEEYKRIYNIYIQKSDDELQRIINQKNALRWLGTFYVMKERQLI